MKRAPDHINSERIISSAGVPLTQAPRRRCVRLLGFTSGSPEAGCLSALGVREGEVVYIHQHGEPTIVSVGDCCGRRIGMSAAAAGCVRVTIDS